MAGPERGEVKRREAGRDAHGCARCPPTPLTAAAGVTPQTTAPREPSCTPGPQPVAPSGTQPVAFRLRLQGSNLLIDESGQLKLADFGLARPFDDQNKQYTNRVITLWYRPPELLLGATQYGPAIDLWSAGCILAELLLRKPILPGRNEFEQLDLIFRLQGTPTEETWEGVSKHSYYDLIKQQNQGQRTRLAGAPNPLVAISTANPPLAGAV